ncbi:MAG: hypothetical protein GQ531_04590 [Sulfurovum sp.]|nr:hypothetical protein [Sulfurovum sp.]
MRKVALISLLSSLLTGPLLAGFFPQTVHTSVRSVSGENIQLNRAFPITGMSGAVIHDYGNSLKAITSRIAQTSGNGASKLISEYIIEHEALPSIKTSVQKGDKVIGGYLYKNVLVLAPDADTYAKVTKSYSKTWIHPDLFALYLSVEGESKPTKENLSHFAKKYQVGLVYIVRKDAAVLLDPISGKIIAKKSVSNLPAKGQFPFYMHFEKLESGWFGGSASGNYYNMVGAL